MSHYNFPRPKVVYSDVLFCPISSPKAKYIQFIIKENHKILTFVWLERANIWHSCLKTTKIIDLIINIVGDLFLY